MTPRIALYLMAVILAVFPAITQAESPVAIAIHAGAGTIERQDLSAEKEREIRARLEEAARPATRFCKAAAVAWTP